MNTAVFLGWAESHVSTELEHILRSRPELRLVFVRHCGFGEAVDQDEIAPNGADYLFSFGPLIVRRPLLDRIRIAAVNFHTGPPRWPGRGSVSFALLHGDREFGVTAHLMVEDVDAGAILRVHRFPIEPGDSVESLDRRTKAAIPDLVSTVLDDLAAGGPAPSRERWERRAMTEADLVAQMRVEVTDDDAAVIRRVKAFAHPTKPGPYVDRAGIRFWHLGGGPPPNHHPVFARFARGSGPIPNWLGVTTSREYFAAGLRFVELSLPRIDTEYFEWTDLLEAVVNAEGRFTMLELGAGYGRWIVNAAAAVRSYSGLPTSFVAVEAEPTHFEWLRLHCRENGVVAETIRAAVAATAGIVEFAVGNPAGWYGQAIADETWSPERTEPVEAVTLTSLLVQHDRIDLIHMDLQGAEAAVLESARDELRRVRRIHVGTHGRGQEERLRALFGALGWTCLHDFESLSTSRTPYGEMTFQDGVQTWLSPTA